MLEAAWRLKAKRRRKRKKQRKNKGGGIRIKGRQDFKDPNSTPPEGFRWPLQVRSMMPKIVHIRNEG